MEVLISTIPDSVKRLISESSSVDDLRFTCSSLLNFFRNSLFFHQLVSDLTNLDTAALCRKNKEAAMETKAKGNECFDRGEYSGALRFYSQALRTAPNDAQDKENNLVSTLYLNRSSTLHKLGLIQESLRDCNRALMSSPAYAKAWYRRGKINSSLGNSEDAIRDFSVSLIIENSLAGKRQIESELNLLSKQPVIRSNDINKPNENSSEDENIQVELRCVSGEARGRGLVASTDISPALLVHKEDPYAAIISKPCRETHCAYCFNELPVDTVPCLSCSAPLYCSEKCRFQAGGEELPRFEDDDFGGSLQRLPTELLQHIRRNNVTSSGESSSDGEQFHEHRHECRGMNWSSVLPSPLVLAGRILVRNIEKRTHKSDGIPDLCQNYGRQPAERKLDFHFFSVVLLYCLHQFNPSRLPLDSAIASQIVVILSQIAVNSFSIVRQKYGDDETEPLSSNATSSIEQVEVAQAIYSRGSLYNHSCLPNVHAYFLSRTLFMRATENITAGSELELCYGPQVGQSSFIDRQKFLDYVYSFRCKCSGCSELILSDLVHGSYRCKVHDCNGVILDYGIAECVKEKFQLSQWGHDGFLKMMMHHLSDVRIHRLGRLFNENNHTSPEKSSLFGKCLSCGSSCDLRAPQKAIDKADINVERLRESESHGEIPSEDAITDAVKSLGRLRKVLHPLNYKIAEVENVLAKAFCLIGDMQAAYRHCKASFEILEALHGKDHIIVGNELIKLSSVQHFVGPAASAAESISRLRAIFSRHYGSHANLLLPHLPQ